MTYPTTKKGHLLALLGAIFGVGGFLLGFLFKAYSIGWGEVLAAIPLAVFVNIVNNSKKII
jgi:1,4-dihydroxy-2-naphthoate octaprenyltransferase